MNNSDLSAIENRWEVPVAANIYAHRYISDESLSCCCFLCLQVFFDAPTNGNEAEIGGDNAV